MKTKEEILGNVGIIKNTNTIIANAFASMLKGNWDSLTGTDVSMLVTGYGRLVEASIKSTEELSKVIESAVEVLEDEDLQNKEQYDGIVIRDIKDEM